MAGSRMTALLWSIGIGFLLGLIGAIQEHWLDNEWVDNANRWAEKEGLPTATHRKSRLGRVSSVMAVNPDDGQWYWKAYRP
jgi:hypothetical protein